MRWLTVRSWDDHPRSCLCACKQAWASSSPSTSALHLWEIFVPFFIFRREGSTPLLLAFLSGLVVRDLLHWRVNALTSFLPQLAQVQATRPVNTHLALLDHRHWTNRKGVDLWYLTSWLSFWAITGTTYPMFIPGSAKPISHCWNHNPILEKSLDERCSLLLPFLFFW